MKQTGTLDNACGIIACIHAIFNTGVKIDPESVLGKYFSENAGKTPMERCVSLEGNDGFKAVHQSYANQGQSAAITGDQSKVRHHFIAYVVSNGQLIELDGCKKGPHVIGPCEDVLRGSIAEVQKRLAAGEISESLAMMTLNSA